MHGAGNDFIVLDAIRQDLSKISMAQWRALADRHFGIGADQILLVESPQGQADFRYRIFNADGGEVEQCGNGSRCFARFVHEQGLSQQNQIRVEVGERVITLQIRPDGQVTVNMGTPIFANEAIPVQTNALLSRHEGDEVLYQLPISDGANQTTPWVSVLSMGNPHAVQVVEDIKQAPVRSEGPVIMQHKAFPKQVNVGYMQIVDPQKIYLRVFERGAGETLACGTGACAAVVAGIRRGLLQSPVHVFTRGGILEIAWDGDVVWMTGPAQTVFDGEVDLSAFSLTQADVFA